MANLIKRKQLENVTGQRLWGRFSETAGILQEITIGAGLTLDPITGIIFVTPSFVGLIDDISFEFRDITKGVAQTYILDLKALYGYTIESAILETDSGTMTGVSIKIGVTAVTSLSNVTVDTVADETASSGAKTVAAGNQVTIATSAGFTGTPTVLRGKLKIKRT